jgi:hypothetical protein
MCYVLKFLSVYKDFNYLCPDNSLCGFLTYHHVNLMTVLYDNESLLMFTCDSFLRPEEMSCIGHYAFLQRGEHIDCILFYHLHGIESLTLWMFLSVQFQLSLK